MVRNRIPEPDRDDAEWVEAPAGSHVARFRICFSQNTPLVGRFRSKSDDRVFIQVVFKATKTSGERTYNYFFADTDKAIGVFNSLKASDHPGQVVHEQLKQAGITFERAS